MEKITELTEEQKNYAIDLMVTLIVEELCAGCDMDATTVLSDFVSSKTGALLYDEESKLWWRGPSDIADMYRKEKEVTASSGK